MTGSADKSVKIFDMGMQKEVAAQKSTGAVFCGSIVRDSLLITGCDDGNILAFDLRNLECLWGYGADEAGAVHCIKIAPDHRSLVTAGDAG